MIHYIHDLVRQNSLHLLLSITCGTTQGELHLWDWRNRQHIRKIEFPINGWIRYLCPINETEVLCSDFKNTSILTIGNPKPVEKKGQEKKRQEKKRNYWK